MTRRVMAWAIALLATAGAAGAANAPAHAGIDEATARKAIAMCTRIGAGLVGLDLKAPVTSTTSAIVRCMHDDGSTVDLTLDLSQPQPARGASAASAGQNVAPAAATAKTPAKPQPAPSGGLVLRQADVDAGPKSDAASEACYRRVPGSQPISLSLDDSGTSGTILCRKVDVYGADPNPITEFRIPFTVAG